MPNPHVLILTRIADQTRLYKSANCTAAAAGAQRKKRKEKRGTRRVRYEDAGFPSRNYFPSFKAFPTSSRLMN